MARRKSTSHSISKRNPTGRGTGAAPANNSTGELRIIGGDWRSRKLRFPDAGGVRPTPARTRETLFNWLNFHLAGSDCLDLFAGSGALAWKHCPEVPQVPPSWIIRLPWPRHSGTTSGY